MMIIGLLLFCSTATSDICEKLSISVLLLRGKEAEVKLFVKVFEKVFKVIYFMSFDNTTTTSIDPSEEKLKWHWDALFSKE